MDNIQMLGDPIQFFLKLSISITCQRYGCVCFWRIWILYHASSVNTGHRQNTQGRKLHGRQEHVNASKKIKLLLRDFRSRLTATAEVLFGTSSNIRSTIQLPFDKRLPVSGKLHSDNHTANRHYLCILGTRSPTCMCLTTVKQVKGRNVARHSRCTVISSQQKKCDSLRCSCFQLGDKASVTKAYRMNVGSLFAFCHTENKNQ